MPQLRLLFLVMPLMAHFLYTIMLLFAARLLCLFVAAIESSQLEGGSLGWTTQQRPEAVGIVSKVAFPYNSSLTAPKLVEP